MARGLTLVAKLDTVLRRRELCMAAYACVLSVNSVVDEVDECRDKGVFERPLVSLSIHGCVLN